MAIDWQMPPASGACAACGRAFRPAEAFRAALYESAQALERRDYCLDCPLAPDPAPLAHWMARRADEASSRPAATGAQSLYDVFTQLDRARPEVAPLRFALALLLWRRRVLRLVRTDAAGGVETWHFTATAFGDEPHAVERPDLDDPQMERLSEQLERLMSGAAPASEAHE